MVRLSNNLQVCRAEDGHQGSAAVFHEQTGHAHLFAITPEAQHNNYLLRL